VIRTYTEVHIIM